MRILVLIWLTVALACAQGNHVQQYFYSGTNLQYVCDSPASVDKTTVSRSDAGPSLVAIVVSSNVGTVTTTAAHNLWVGARVTVAGSAMLPLNGTYTVLTVPSSTTYTIATVGVTDATYNAAGIVINTNSPLLTSAVWYVTVYLYSGSSLIATYPGGGSLSLNYRAKCSDRAGY